MFNRCLVLAVLASSVVWGAAPTYSTDSILNGADFTPGPFAPGSIVTIFGADLSFGTAGIPTGSQNNALPDFLADVRVYVNNLTSPLIYVCPTQINFVVPDNLLAGRVPVRVVRQGVTGPEAKIMLADAAPKLFTTQAGYAIAQHGADYSMVTPNAPARAGEVVVIYATGLGRTAPEPAVFEIPQYAGLLVSGLQLFLDGSQVSPDRIFYAGLTPGSAGVYQVNVTLPDELGSDPEIRVTVAAQVSTAGVKLPVQPATDGTR
jgi:uncharacterized protein (TIGR03437 family)